MAHRSTGSQSVRAAKALRQRLSGLASRVGYEIARAPTADNLGHTRPDLEEQFRDLYALCAPYTATSVERMFATWQAVSHIIATGVPGDLVECGVWRGGNAMLMAHTLHAAGDGERALYLYDTFSGMSAPTEKDVGPDGRVLDDWESIRSDQDHPILAYASRADVETNLGRTPLAQSRIHLIEGKVEDTIPATVPERIAVLRLDTDWYESTLHELEHLWPRLVSGGILLIDDYGHWVGARAAVDEFFSGRADAPLLARTDSTGRLAVKR